MLAYIAYMDPMGTTVQLTKSMLGLAESWATHHRMAYNQASNLWSDRGGFPKHLIVIDIET
jgi:hypothetical protein